MLPGPVCLSPWLLLVSPAPALGQILSCILLDLDSTIPGVPQVREGGLALEGTLALGHVLPLIGCMA